VLLFEDDEKTNELVDGVGDDEDDDSICDFLI